MLVASRLGRRPKRLKEMQMAAVAAAVGGSGNMPAVSCTSSADQYLETSSAAMPRLCMSSCYIPSAVNSSLDVADVQAELQVHSATKPTSV